LVPIVAIGWAVLSPQPAFAHYLGYDSVDSGEIRYKDQTQWDDARANAISSWNDLAAGVYVALDTASTVADLEFKDYSANDTKCGKYANNSGADDAWANNAFYNGYGQRDRRACTLHELGHAHGLAHSYNDEAMDDCPVSGCLGGSSYIVPQVHDKNDYYNLW
jgi:hypothetical protein